MNYTIPLAVFHDYIGALIVMRRDVGADAFNIDDLPPPPPIAAFYERVHNGSIHYDGNLAVLFHGNVVGITTDQNVAIGAMTGCADCKRLRASSLAWAYSLWRYWVKAVVDLGFSRPDLDHPRLVRLCTVKVPRHNNIVSLVPFEDVGPAPFVPEQPAVVIDSDSSDEFSSRGSSPANSPPPVIGQLGGSTVEVPPPALEQPVSTEDRADSAAVERMMVFEGYYGDA